MEFFDPTSEAIAEALPSWWAHRQPGTELAIHIAVLGQLADASAQEVEQIHADTSLATAGRDGLLFEWAPLFGAGQEQLPFETETLRAYLQARAREDGTKRSLIRTLLALTHNTDNDTGTPLRFPASGGLRFPPVGGLQLHEAIADGIHLQFPPTGGLRFPVSGGIRFPPFGRLEVIEHPADHYVEVIVRRVLVFDRPAFGRAIERHRMADDLPHGYTET